MKHSSRKYEKGYEPPILLRRIDLTQIVKITLKVLKIQYIANIKKYQKVSLH